MKNSSKNIAQGKLTSTPYPSFSLSVFVESHVRAALPLLESLFLPPFTNGGEKLNEQRSQGESGFVETEPKTRRGRRKIAVSDKLLEALKAHSERQEQMRLKAGKKWNERGLVFCHIYGGFLLVEVVSNQFHALLARAGLPDMRFHDLRHTMATMLLEADVHPKKVQERLGHSNISMTMDTYSHVLPSMHQDVARKLDDLFKE